MDIYEAERQRILRTLYSSTKRPTSESDLDDGQLRKIRNHADRFGHTVDQVMNGVFENELVYRFVLGGHPGRMDYWENALVEYLNHQSEVRKATKLPKSGPGRIYIIDGKVCGTKPEELHLKSIDILVEFRNHVLGYIVHKYTAEAGGAQDNQWREADYALSHARTPDGKDFVQMIGVLDGAYYQSPRRNGLSRLEETRKARRDAIVCTYRDFITATTQVWNQK
jgi:hypothetical protein